MGVYNNMGMVTTRIAKCKTKEEDERRMAKKVFRFSVKCSYEYDIEADDEHTAKTILVQEGGLSIEGKLCLDNQDYENAELIETIYRGGISDEDREAKVIRAKKKD